MNRVDAMAAPPPLFAETRGDIAVSFEFFPPRTDKMAETLWESIQTLEPLQPRFVSVTYGAGGSTRERTHATVERILKETTLTPAAHLTCVGASKGELDDIARDYWNLGVRHIVALRGDPPEPGTKYQPHPDGYRDACELVAGLKKVAPFDISIAAYPEMHPDSSTRAFDLENLKRKVGAGADRAITQFFFSADCFFRFRDEAAAAGIDAEIVPGILPVSNVATTRRFAQT
ncbi:MAG TPA: methylenetetrahydrofolate reductase, partial [Sphingomicrobium sp.]|nr:methylenetetrahydrofolate reductase [Sphingomicrobium sp.]